MGSSTATFHTRAVRPAPGVVSLESLKAIGMLSLKAKVSDRNRGFLAQGQYKTLRRWPTLFADDAEFS